MSKFILLTDEKNREIILNKREIKSIREWDGVTGITTVDCTGPTLYVIESIKEIWSQINEN